MSGGLDYDVNVRSVGAAGSGCLDWRGRGVIGRFRTGFERESDADGRASTFGAVDGDRAAVLRHDALASPQPEPAAGNSAGHVAAAAEALEDMRQVGGRDADTLIRDGEDGERAVGSLFEVDPHHNGAPRRAVLDGVGNKILQYPRQPVGIPQSDHLGNSWPPAGVDARQRRPGTR